MRSAASWSDAERAYVELHDVAAAYPRDFASALSWLMADAASEQAEQTP